MDCKASKWKERSSDLPIRSINRTHTLKAHRNLFSVFPKMNQKYSSRKRTETFTIILGWVTDTEFWVHGVKTKEVNLTGLFYCMLFLYITYFIVLESKFNKAIYFVNIIIHISSVFSTQNSAWQSIASRWMLDEWMNELCPTESFQMGSSLHIYLVNKMIWLSLTCQFFFHKVVQSLILILIQRSSEFTLKDEMLESFGQSDWREDSQNHRPRLKC